jgi:hypothetical protein
MLGGSCRSLSTTRTRVRVPGPQRLPLNVADPATKGDFSGRYYSVQLTVASRLPL